MSSYVQLLMEQIRVSLIDKFKYLSQLNLDYSFLNWTNLDIHIVKLQWIPVDLVSMVLMEGWYESMVWLRVTCFYPFVQIPAHMLRMILMNEELPCLNEGNKSTPMCNSQPTLMPRRDDFSGLVQDLLNCLYEEYTTQIYNEFQMAQMH